MSLFSTVTMDSASNFRTIWADEVKRREKKGGEKTVLSFGQPLQPRRRGGCLSKPKNHHQLTCKAILHHHDRLFKRLSPKDGGSAVSGPSDFRWHDRALRHLRAGCQQVAVIVPDVRLLVGPPSCTSPFTSRQSHHVSSPYFKQLILGLWLDFCFTNFLDFNCDGYYDGALSARARGFTFCVHFY